MFCFFFQPNRKREGFSGRIFNSIFDDLSYYSYFSSFFFHIGNEEKKNLVTTYQHFVKDFSNFITRDEEIQNQQIVTFYNGQFKSKHLNDQIELWWQMWNMNADFFLYKSANTKNQQRKMKNQTYIWLKRQPNPLFCLKIYTVNGLCVYAMNLGVHNLDWARGAIIWWFLFLLWSVHKNHRANNPTEQIYNEQLIERLIISANNMITIYELRSLCVRMNRQFLFFSS